MVVVMMLSKGMMSTRMRLMMMMVVMLLDVQSLTADALTEPTVYFFMSLAILAILGNICIHFRIGVESEEVATVAEQGPVRLIFGSQPDDSVSAWC
jgi:hypothetical protein